MSSKSYLAGASALTAAIVTVTVLALVVMQTNLTRLRRISVARIALERALMLHHVRADGVSQPDDRPAFGGALGARATYDLALEPQPKRDQYVSFKLALTVREAETVWTVTDTVGGYFREGGLLSLCPPPAEYGEGLPLEPEPLLAGIEAELGLPTPLDLSFQRFVPRFIAVHDKLMNQSVKVPFVEVEFDTRTTSWLLFAIILSGLLVARSRLRIAWMDPQAGMDEPFFLLDAEGAEQVFRLLWIGAVLLAPWLAGAPVFVVEAGRRFIEKSSWAPAEWVFIAMLAAMTCGGLLSIQVVAQLLALARRRRELRTQAIVPGG